MDEDQFLSSDLASQLTDILATIITEKPPNALGLFESLATFHHTGKMVPEKTSSVYTDDATAQPEVTVEDLQNVAWAKEYAELVVPPKPPKKLPKDGEDEEPEPEPEPEEDKGELADITAEQATFNLMGVGLTETESYRLMVSLKRLLDKQPLKTARFWGKIFAKKGDYYVAEAEIDPDRAPEEPEAEAAEEAEGEEKGPDTILKVLAHANAPSQQIVPAEGANQPGNNKYQYWVTTDLCTWTKLPDVQPIHIQYARYIKKYFTGDLQAAVSCHPPFPGLEQDYLRAQIARITHGCRVVPRGMFDPPAEEDADEDAPPKTTFKIAPYETIPEITPANPEELPEPDDEAWQKPVFAMWGKGYMHATLMELDNWMHVEPALLQTQGRTTEYKFPKEDDEEAEAAEEEEGAKPPIEMVAPLCTEVGRDDDLQFTHHATKNNPAWAVRKAACVPSGAAQQVYMIRSLRWPGYCSSAVVQDNKPGAQVAHTYIGYGLKSGVAEAFAPPAPEVNTETTITKTVLQVDYTPDDELEFAPPPPPPAPIPVEGEEEGEEDEDA
eukprot:TRINITY_DN1350_c0_g1_i1.p1 TRINITY_DN1350_c0_g1~~TRINITY_DN1350_c0_g1_i1.p1  ORF type:complete len:554 (+),score=249.82 TRINITY_DN1350_c0_g1_i1:75-1736(+)